MALTPESNFFGDTTQNTNVTEDFSSKHEETGKMTPKSIHIPRNMTQKIVAITQDYTKSINRCQGKRYGENCTQACPTNCAGDGSCYMSTGECTLGCAPGYYQAKCDAECVNCLDKACNQKTRQCIAGCMPGFRGLTCTESDSSQGNILMYMILTVCLVLLLIMMVFVAYKFQRHRARVRLARETRYIQRANENMDDLNFLVARLSQFQSPPPKARLSQFQSPPTVKGKPVPQRRESEDSESDAEEA